MIIKPVISGVVCRTSHPLGCKYSVQKQIEYVKKASKIINGPKKVLILGASSGFGLASRISLAFGGPKADTIGVSYERKPTSTTLGSSGWYNSLAFRQEAEQNGLIARDFIGDAFSQEMRENVAAYIKNEFGGKIDAVIYSVATGIRPNKENGGVWKSSLKTIGEPFVGRSVNLEKGILETSNIEPATSDEIEQTIKVMGGEDWLSWVNFLKSKDVLNEGFKTFAYSYIGPELTYPIYHHGTLGYAKKHLHHTGDIINDILSDIHGGAYIVVCKALVTKASVFIPAFSEYILLLYKIMKEKGLHEGCIEQMQRLFSQKIYGHDGIVTEKDRLIRMDDYEMREDVQSEILELYKKMTPENFKTVGDYKGYVSDFLNLNGFALDTIDYNAPIDMDDINRDEN